MRTKKYQDELIRSLRDPLEASKYLNAALEEKNTKIFLLALRNVAKSFGGLPKISKKSGLNRENLYRMLSKKGNPEILSLKAVLKSVGLRLAVEIKNKHPKRTHIAA